MGARTEYLFPAQIELTWPIDFNNNIFGLHLKNVRREPVKPCALILNQGENKEKETIQVTKLEKAGWEKLKKQSSIFEQSKICFLEK